MMIILTFIVLLLDIVSKIVISKLISYDSYVWIIKNFLGITYVKNEGVAWSLFQNMPVLVICISFIIIIGIILYVYRNKPNNIIQKISYSLIIGGAIGNFLDRIFNGYVIDFISIKIFNYSYPIFNLADVFIVLGVIILIFYTWRYEKNGDRSTR